MLAYGSGSPCYLGFSLQGDNATSVFFHYVAFLVGEAQAFSLNFSFRVKGVFFP